MLQLTIPDLEVFDDKKGEFNIIKGQTIQLEHSLVSVSKWESKWKKAFLGKDPKTIEETIDYVKCMTITQNVRSEIYNNLTNENVDMVSEYIKSPMTATRLIDNRKETSKETFTSEIIYYLMITYNIPFECQKWHLNRLLTLIKVCDLKNNKPKKMSKAEIINRNIELNNQRRQQLNSKG